MVHWTTCHDHIAHRTALSGRMRTVVRQSILHPLRLEPIIILFEYLIKLSLIYDLFRFDAISAANFRFEASISSAFISPSATLEDFCLRVVLLTLSCKKMKCQNPLFTWAKWNDIFRDYFETHRKSTEHFIHANNSPRCRKRAEAIKMTAFILIPFIKCPTQYQKKYKNMPRMSNNLSDTERLSHEMWMKT